MARIPRLKRLYLRQRRSGIEKIKLRELNNEAHRRAAAISSERFKRICKDMFGFDPQDIDSRTNDVRRKFIGLDECHIKTPREEILARVNFLAERAELIHRVDTKALFLIRDYNNYYFFVYRETGLYYKKSLHYDSRTTAMKRYNDERITWLHFYNEKAK